MTDPATTTTSTTSGAGSAVLGPDPTRGPSSAPADTDPAAVPVRLAAAGSAPAPTVAVYRDADGREHFASPHVKATHERVATGEWTEVDGSAGPFDPTEHRVRDVVAYLAEHAAEPAEVARVKAAEAAGEDRPTIRDWSPEQ